jgi:flagellar biosynthesis/type III secretory pathway protein FliH
MARLLLTLCLGTAFIASAAAQDLHLHEDGSAVVISHSAFAHGYRHGYEEGYHIGNTDISVGTPSRPKLKGVHGVKLGYSSEFGPRPVFEKGFQAGLKVGYRDGYCGHAFRAVESLRSVAIALEEAQLAADQKFTHFDQGFFNGYNDGFERGSSTHPLAAQVDFHFVQCANSSSVKKGGQPAQDCYCEGYKRGFALGHTDGFVLGADAARLEASK